VAELLTDARESPRVIDVGAHIGLFGLYIRSCCPTARITSFEPDPKNAALLERTVSANELGDSWEIVRAAASTASARVGFVAGLGERSHLAEAGAQAAVTVDAVDLFDRLDGVDLLKVDIEGGEWSILADARFLTIPARAIVVEHHAYLCPEPDPERAAAVRLAEAGYEVVSADASLTPEVGVLWALRASATGRSRGRSGAPPASVASETG
jgi:FkbM family methyltransferase